MGRPLRQLTPGTRWFVTTRCVEARFLLRPAPLIYSTIGLFLARSCHRYQGIRLLGAVSMSNHLHLLLVDTQSQLSSFMEYLLGQLARDINRIRNRRSPLFERRFSAEPVLDDLALRGWLLYLILNPVRAALVARHEQWPGLCLFARDQEPAPFSFRRFRRDRYEAAVRRCGKNQAPPKPLDFYEEQALTVHPLPTGASGPAGSLMAEIRRQEGALGEQRRREGKQVLGAEGVRAQSSLAAPARPKRSVRALCHTVFIETYRAFRELMRSLRDAFALASAAFRGGAFDVEFPPYTYRPGVPLEA